MASNKELVKEALELAGELDLAINTEGLNNKKLAALVSDLKAKKTDADTETQADTAPAVEVGAAPMEPTEPEPKRYPFSVAAGKAVTSKRGILAEGEEITVKDLAGGDASMKALVKSKHVLKA